MGQERCIGGDDGDDRRKLGLPGVGPHLRQIRIGADVLAEHGEVPAGPEIGLHEDADRKRLAVVTDQPRGGT